MPWFSQSWYSWTVSEYLDTLFPLVPLHPYAFFFSWGESTLRLQGVREILLVNTVGSFPIGVLRTWAQEVSQKTLKATTLWPEAAGHVPWGNSIAMPVGEWPSVLQWEQVGKRTDWQWPCTNGPTIPESWDGREPQWGVRPTRQRTKMCTYAKPPWEDDQGPELP